MMAAITTGVRAPFLDAYGALDLRTMVELARPYARDLLISNLGPATYGAELGIYATLRVAIAKLAVIDPRDQTTRGIFRSFGSMRPLRLGSPCAGY